MATDSVNTISDAFREVLLLDEVPASVSLFDLGGHSLTAVALAIELSEQFGTDVSVRDVYDHPSIEAMAAHLVGSDDPPTR